MPKPVYQFSLRRVPGTYYYLDASGVVLTSAIRKEIKHSIVDWDKLQLQWRRHSVYHGVMRNFAPEAIKIAKNGAAILRHIFNTEGSVEALCELEIYKLKSTDQLYYPRGVCAIDFSKYNNSELSVQVSLMQGGLSATLNAYDTLDFTIPLKDPDIDPDYDQIWISGDPGTVPGGVMLLGQYNYQSQGDGNADIVLNDTPARNFEESTLGMVFVNQEGAYAVATNSSPLMGVRVDTGAGGGIGLIENANISKAVNGFTGTFSGEFKFQTIANAFTSTQDARLKIRARVYNGDWSHVVDNVQIWADPFGFISPGAFSTTVSTGVITYTHTFNPGDFLVITARMETPTSQTSGTTTQLQVTLDTQPTDLQLTFQYQQPDTPCRVLSQWQLFRKLFHSLTGSTAVDPISNLLTTDVYPGPNVYNLNPVNTMITSGDALRQLYTDAEGNPVDPAIKTNFRDFAQDVLTSNCAGIGIERDGGGNEVLRLEHLSHFYQKDVLLKDLGIKITNWKMYPYTDYIGNKIKAGTAPQNYDEVNGRFEFNGDIGLQAPITRVQRDIDLMGRYRRDCYGIEYVRANLANKKTTDSSSDNDTFKIQSSGNRLAIPGMDYNPLQVDKAHTILAGLPAEVRPTVYNVPFTGGRDLGRLKPWLKSLHYGLTDPILKFTSGSKNTGLESTMYTGPLVRENSNIILTATTDELLFIPQVFEFDAEVPMDLPEIMDTNPYGVFGHTITRKRNRYYFEGFALEVGINDAERNSYNFKLLCSPNTPVPDNF